MDTKKDPLQQLVLDAIKSGKVTMRPKWHFALTAALAAIGTVLVLLTILYLVSFILFIVHDSGLDFAPSFGPSGWFIFLRSLPWLLIILSIIFIAVLEMLVRHYSFGFRRPLLYSVGGIIIIVIVGGFVVSRTTFHRELYHVTAMHGAPPFARHFYHEFGERHFDNVFTGVITATTTTTYTMDSPQGMSITILINEHTRIPTDADFERGDRIFVFGIPNNGVITAIGMREIGE